MARSRLVGEIREGKMLIKGVKVTTKWGLKNIKKKTQREGERERERLYF